MSFVAAAATMFPASALAQTLPTPGPGTPGGAPVNLSGLVALIERIAGFIFGGLIIGAFIMFLIGGIYYLMGAASEESRKKAKDFLIYGAVAVIVGFAAFAVANVLKFVVGAV